LTLKPWIYATATPLLAFAAFFGGFYALLLSPSRSDWPLVVVAGAAAIAGAIGAFVVRKAKPNTALALAAAPSFLLLVVILAR
jgi:hypothetical protein